jgi:hypothetical protein
MRRLRYRDRRLPGGGAHHPADSTNMKSRLPSAMSRQSERPAFSSWSGPIPSHHGRTTAGWGRRALIDIATFTAGLRRLTGPSCLGSHREQRKIYDIVLRAQKAAIALVRPGSPRPRSMTARKVIATRDTANISSTARATPERGSSANPPTWERGGRTSPDRYRRR